MAPEASPSSRLTPFYFAISFGSGCRPWFWATQFPRKPFRKETWIGESLFYFAMPRQRHPGDAPVGQQPVVSNQMRAYFRHHFVEWAEAGHTRRGSVGLRGPRSIEAF